MDRSKSLSTLPISAHIIITKKVAEDSIRRFFATSSRAGISGGALLRHTGVELRLAGCQGVLLRALTDLRGAWDLKNQDLEIQYKTAKPMPGLEVFHSREAFERHCASRPVRPENDQTRMRRRSVDTVLPILPDHGHDYDVRPDALLQVPGVVGDTPPEDVASLVTLASANITPLAAALDIPIQRAQQLADMLAVTAPKDMCNVLLQQLGEVPPILKSIASATSGKQTRAGVIRPGPADPDSLRDQLISNPAHIVNLLGVTDAEAIQIAATLAQGPARAALESLASQPYGFSPNLAHALSHLEVSTGAPRPVGKTLKVQQAKELYDAEAAGRALEFFNKVQDADSIVATIKDDPQRDPDRDEESPYAYGVRRKLAEKILARRLSAGGAFRNIDEIREIRGVGPDTFHDIIHTFRWAPEPTAPTACADLPDDPSTITGAFDAWPENTFSLYSVLADVSVAHPNAEPDDPNVYVSYEDEALVVDAALVSLEGGDELTKLVTKIRPILARCATITHRDASNDVPNHPLCHTNCGYLAADGLTWTRSQVAQVNVYCDGANQTINEVFTQSPNGRAGAYLELAEMLQNPGLQLDGPAGLFARLNTLRRRARELRSDIEALRLAGEGDDWIDSDLVIYKYDIFLPADFDWRFLPNLEVFYRFHFNCGLYDLHCDIEFDCDPFQRLFEHECMIYELDRVIPVLDEVAVYVNYAYFRLKALQVLQKLHRGHSYLNREQFGLATQDYNQAFQLVSDALERIDDLRTNNAPEYEYYSFRVTSISSAFNPADEAKEVWGGLAILAIVCLFSPGQDACKYFRRAGSADWKPITDGKQWITPIEDWLHYVRGFVIPACKAEAFLQRGLYQGGVADFDLAIEHFKNATYYLGDERNTPAHHFLWLRMARTFLFKGIAQYNRADSSIARQAAKDTLSLVLARQYGGRVDAPAELLIDGELKRNPLQVAMEIEACDVIRNIDFGINPLGYSNSYIPGIRWDTLRDIAAERAGQLNAAEEKYLQFRIAAEDADARLAQLDGNVAIAAAESISAQRQEAAASEELDATADAHANAMNQLQRAEEALEEYQFWTEFRLATNLGYSVIGSLPWFGGGVGGYQTTFNTMSSDMFQLSQLRRDVERLQDAVGQAQRRVEVSTRLLDSSRAALAVARIREQVVRDQRDYELEREFNYARWYAMADEMHDIIRFRIRDALRYTFLTQQALFYMTSHLMPVLSFQAGDFGVTPDPDRFDANLAAIDSSLFMGQRIIDALATLQHGWIRFLNDPNTDYVGWESPNPPLVLELEFHKGSSIFNYDITQWERFRTQGGQLEFSLSLEHLDCFRHGGFQRLIDSIELYGTVSDIGTQSVISAQLTNSPHSIVRINDTTNAAGLVETEDWLDTAAVPAGFRTVVKPNRRMETLEFPGPLTPEAGSGYGFSSVQLGAFENNGMCQHWVLEISSDENDTLDFSSFLTLTLRFRYSQRRSPTLALAHQAGCSAQQHSSSVLVYLWSNFFTPGQPPFETTDLVATLQLLEQDLPAVHRDNATLKEIGVLFVPNAGQSLPNDLHCKVAIAEVIDPVTGEPIIAASSTMALDISGETGQGTFNEEGAGTHPFDVFRGTPLMTTNADGTFTGSTFHVCIDTLASPASDFSELQFANLYLVYTY